MIGSILPLRAHLFEVIGLAPRAFYRMVVVESFLAGACPIAGSCGAKDRWNRRVADVVDRILTAVGVAHHVKEYPEAGHSFLNNHQNVFFRMLKVVGIGYHEPSAQDSRRRIVAFFNAHLKS